MIRYKKLSGYTENHTMYAKTLLILAVCLSVSTTLLSAGAVTAVPRTNEIILDGDDSDFNKSAPLFIAQRELIASEYEPGRTWKGTNDLSATVYINFDDEFLYLLFDVRDDIRTHRNRMGKYWTGDGVEVFFSRNFLQRRTNTVSDHNDYQFYFLPPVAPGETLFISKAKGGVSTESALSYSGITAASKEFGGRYAVEIRVPLIFFGTECRTRGIGINIAIDDADGTSYRKTQLCLNGSPKATFGPGYLEPIAFSGSFRATRRIHLPVPFIIAICISLIIMVVYGIALKHIIIAPLSVKIRFTVISAGIMLVCVVLLLVLTFAEKHFRDARSRTIARIDATMTNTVTRAFAGKMDFADLSERLYAYACGSNVSGPAVYEATPLIPAIGTFRSLQGTPVYFESLAEMKTNFKYVIGPVHARGVHIIMSAHNKFPEPKTAGAACRITFHAEDGRTFTRVFTNGVDFFRPDHRYLISSNTAIRFHAGIRTINDRSRNVTGIVDEYEIVFPGAAVITAVSYDPLMNDTVAKIYGITFLGTSDGEFITGPFLKFAKMYSWQGTRFKRVPGFIASIEGFSGTFSEVRYHVNGSADEVRVQYSGDSDSVSLESIPFGATVAAIDIHYRDGTVTRTPIIDGLSHSATSEVFGHGHPPHYTSMISRRTLTDTGMLHHGKEIAIPTRPDKEIESVSFISLLPGADMNVEGVTVIRKARSWVDYPPLSPDDRKSIGFAETLVYYNGVLRPAMPSSKARAAVQTYFKEHPPYRNSFSTARIIDTGDGTIVATPLRLDDDTAPIALVRYLTGNRFSMASSLLKGAVVIMAFFTFAAVVLLLTHFIIDARRLSIKMLAISLSLAVIPLAAATALFTYIYNRNAVGDVLSGRAALSESFIKTEVSEMLSQLADISKNACAAVLSGGAVREEGPVRLLLHDIDPKNHMHVMRYSSNTPGRYFRAESPRLLKRSGPILTSTFGPVLAWTTIVRTNARILSVTAFREIDDAVLKSWTERTGSSVSVHFLNGYQHASLLAGNNHINVEFSRSGVVRIESAERRIGGKPYYLHAFPLKNGMQEDQMIIGTAIDMAVVSQTRLFIIAGGIAFALIAGMLAFAIAWWFSRRVSGSVLAVAQGMKQIETGDLNTTVTVDAKDETARLADGFNAMARTLANLRMTDLKMAANIQRGLLPALPKAGRYDVAAHFEAYSYVSGDFYDLYTDGNGTLTGLVLFDVSGHGVSSGLITTLVRPIMYRMFTSDTNVPLSDVIARANRSIISAKGDVDNYLTCVMLRFSGDELHYVNAGHPDIIKKDAASDIAPVRNEGSAMQGAFMGLEGMLEFFEETNREYKFPMKAGDTFILFTDGLLEARSPDGKEFGTHGIQQVLADAPSESTAAELIKRLVNAGEKHRAGGALSDDITIVIVKVRE